MKYIVLFFAGISFGLLSCQPSIQVDTVYYNGIIYTVDSSMSIVQAMAVKDGKIYDIGTDEEIKRISSKESIDLNGKFVYPGFYDAHCHFSGYGIDKNKIWLGGTKSFEEIIDTLISRKEDRFMGWIFGRGWDQNDWEHTAYPDNQRLNELFPDIPVFLFRIDGHAAIVNKKAIEIAGLTNTSKVKGGEIVLQNGELTGLLIDNAVDLVKDKIQTPGKDQMTEGLLAAQADCFQVGLTSVADAGISRDVIELMDELQKADQLKMRVYAMIEYSIDNISHYATHGKYKTDRLNVSSFKIYSDGALGSRGACLKEEYSDQHDHHGFLLHDISDFDRIARFCTEHTFQLNVHCIGDSAVHLILNTAAGINPDIRNARWRIEHAQVVDTSNVGLFTRYNIIPSVQPTHATSDMYWAEERLGKDRIKTAYAYKDLLQATGIIASGSDFPVEDINPLYGFYAAVTRKDKSGYPADGFQTENALSREEALKAMTIWAAYAAFEEKEKGSLEAGKFADFVVLESDIMNAPAEKLWNITVLQTFINGENVFSR